jgi:K+/H+ antiporter YhaU regulatory subunit KhtT
MKVRDHKKFCKFDYESDTAPHTYELGDVVTKESENGIEIGVVIQLHEDGDIRTDMFGNASPSEVTMSTIEEIIEFRDELLSEMFEMDERQTKAASLMKELIEKHKKLDKLWDEE